MIVNRCVGCLHNGRGQIAAGREHQQQAAIPTRTRRAFLLHILALLYCRILCFVLLALLCHFACVVLGTKSDQIATQGRLCPATTQYSNTVERSSKGMMYNGRKVREVINASIKFVLSGCNVIAGGNRVSMKLGLGYSWTQTRQSGTETHLEVERRKAISMG